MGNFPAASSRAAIVSAAWIAAPEESPRGCPLHARGGARRQSVLVANGKHLVNDGAVKTAGTKRRRCRALMLPGAAHGEHDGALALDGLRPQPWGCAA
jgi:hypothetical protein